MAWAIQTISNHGTSDAIVARIVIQTIEIAKHSHKEQQELLLVSSGLSRRLLNGREAASLIAGEVAQGIEQLKAIDPVAAQAEIPYVINLEILTEAFFYNAKNIIRDCGTVTRIVYGKRFDDASDWCAFGKRAESEVSKHLGRLIKDHPGYATVRQLVDNYRPLIELVVRGRNALEHPGKASGTLEIANFSAGKDGVRSPAFHFVGEDTVYDLSTSLKEIVEALVELVETVVVFGLMHKFAVANLGVRRIPEAERAADAPVAFQVIHITDEIIAGAKPFDGKPAATASAKGKNGP